jgi:hypothetical protein
MTDAGQQRPELVPNTLEDVRLAVEQINECVERRGSIEEMKELVKVLTAGYSLNFPRFFAGSRFYRARVMPGPGPPLNLSEFGVPPRSCCRSNQRCNRPGEPMFYCSDHPSGPLAEVGAEVGNLVVLSQWLAKDPVVVLQVGYSEATYIRLGFRKPHIPKWMVPPENNNNADHQREVNHYLSELFTQKVPNGEEHRYAPSIAITEKFLSFNVVDEKGLFPDQPDMKIEGIIYPTVALRASCENLALRAEFAVQSLLLEAADFVEILDIDPQEKYNARYLGSVVRWCQPGELIWGFLPMEKRISGSAASTTASGPQLPPPP